jgi:hypothetical protein
MRLHDDKWDQVAETLRESAGHLPFDEIYAIDERKEQPRILRLK